MLTPDKPIETAEEDLLGRSSFATSFGDAIIDYRFKDSIAIGLFGPWGSGKTSIVNMAMEHVVSVSELNDKANPPIIVRFNPWNFSNENQLIAQFFRQLSAALKKPDNTPLIIDVGDKIERYATLLLPISIVAGPQGPAVVGTAVVIGRATKEAGRWWRKKKQPESSDLHEPESSDLHDAREELNGLLRNQPQKIIVILDDIDRLNNTEVRQIFQLVKSLADFPNTVYVLAFDKTVVINALSEEQRDGLQYLEKLIQVHWDVPLISQQTVEQLLFAQLESVFEATPPAIWDKDYWSNIYTRGLNAFFRNLRDVTRYVNSLQFSFSLVNEEVNGVDFFALTALQVFTPALYDKVRDNKDLFAGAANYLDDAKTIENRKMQFDELFDEAMRTTEKVQSLQKQLKDLLQLLFPKLKSLNGSAYYAENWLNDWRKACRVCHPDFFDRFFALSLRKGELSQSEMRAVLALAHNLELFSKALEKLNNEGKSAHFVRFLKDYTDDETRIPLSHISTIVMALLDIGDSFRQREAFFDIPISSAISFRVGELASRLPTQDARFGMLKRAVEYATHSLYTIVALIIDQRIEHGKSETKDNVKPMEAWTINEHQLEELEQLMCSKVAEWAARDKLLRHRMSCTILYIWDRWCPSTNAQGFAKRIMHTDQGLLQLIAGCTLPPRTFYIRNFAPNASWEIDPETLGGLVSLEDIEPIIRKIAAARPENLDERTEKALQTLLMYFENENYRNEFQSLRRSGS